MAAVTITIEDAQHPDDPLIPAVDLKMVYSGGFQKTSHAHQAGQALLKTWEGMMVRAGTPIVDPTIKVPEPMLAVPEGAEATPVVQASRIVLETN